MIKLKLSAMEIETQELPIIPGETILAAVERATAGVPLPERETHATLFQTLHNGYIIRDDMWGLVNLKENDTLIIALKISGGGGGSSLFRAGLQIAVALAATAAFGPAGLQIGATYGAFAYGVAVAGANIVGALLINALIPAAVVDTSQVGTAADSQTYYVNGQSNSVNKLGFVPKVYGNHRIFPYVAANPYTEFQVGTNGELVQYLYAIYDFGLGPMTIENLKIGDSPINLYTDVEMTYVDLNRPDLDEGPWDSGVQKNFRFYKGDSSAQNIATTLDKDFGTAGALESEYLAARTTAANTDGAAQSITLTFVNTRGLYSQSSSGSFGPVTIRLNIQFRLVGSSTWRNWNDPDFASDFITRGGDQSQVETVETLFPIYTYSRILVAGSSGGEGGGGDPEGYTQQIATDVSFNVPPGFVLKSESLAQTYSLSATDKRYVHSDIIGNDTADPYAPEVYVAKTRVYTIPKGAFAAGFKTSPTLIVGRYLYVAGNLLGRITSVTPLSGVYTGYSQVVWDTPAEGGVPFYTYRIGTWTSRNGSIVRTTVEDLFGQIVSTKVINFGLALITRQQLTPVYSTFSFTPKTPGQYVVRVIRNQTLPTYGTTVEASLTWTDMTTRFDRAPIMTDKRHLFLEIKIRATNQLNGSIANLSGVVNSVVPIYNGTSWTYGTSNNPAWIFADLMTGQVNKRALGFDRLETTSLLEWAAFCDAVPTAPVGQEFTLPRYQTNFILDYKSTLQQILNQVGNGASASLNIVDGKYGVLLDKKRTTPVQIFTPRNSSNFQAIRAYSVRPHALKVSYVEPSLDWQVTELIVYDDGYTSANAEEFEDITAFACTNQEQAWRYGRYLLAQNRLRQETISLTVDFEYLVCTRGDYVQISQDVMRVGGTPARVTSVVGNRIVIDDGLDLGAFNYGYTYRAANGQILTSTCTPVFSDTFDLDGGLPAKGDLIVIGEVGSIVFDCLVKAIAPNDNLTATLTLVEKADAIYDSESLTEFPPYMPQISNTSSGDLAAPGPVLALTVVDNFWDCSDGGYRYYIDLDWDAPAGSAYEAFEIYVDSGRGFDIVATTRDSLYRYIVDPSRLDIEHSFKVLAVSATGRKLDIGAVSAVTATPLTKTAYPSDVEFLATDITGEVLQLSWTQIADCDAREYLIRYSPVADEGTWTSSIPLLRVDRNTTLASVQARTGTYLIKAVDFNYNESANAAIAITTIPNLFSLNVISEVTDFPDLLGGFDRTVASFGALTIAESVSGTPDVTEYYSEGFYYYLNLLDLGEIYTVRLQALIQAEGYTAEDIMSNWTTLSSVALLSNARTSEWDVEAQYRASESLNLMADWTQLSLIDPIGGGSEDNFTPWRKFIQGDVTARLLQFRLRLISNKTSVTPRVFAGKIRADMPDRLESYNNIIVPSGGYSVVYSPAFAGPSPSPNVQVSIDGASSGDYWQITGKTVEGFTIQFFDKNGIAVERQADFAIKGFGRRATTIL